MITVRPDVVGIDAVPISSGHGIRGIGRYVSSLITAVAMDESGWMAGHVRPLLLAGSKALDGLGEPWMTYRPRFRPQDTAWLVGAFADRLAIRGDPPSIWHHTDPSMPFSPLPGARTIATLYDLIPLLDPAVRSRIRLHRRAVLGGYLRLVQSAALVIAISGETAAAAARLLHIDPGKLRVVYPAVAAIAGSQRSNGHVGDEAVGLLFVGVPEPHKRPELAIAALAVLRQGGLDAILRFVGPISRKGVEPLRAVARMAGVENSVKFVGRVTDGALGALYSRSVLLAMSRLEGFGLPPVEALLSGGRVVAADNRIYQETLGNAATFALSDTPLAIAEAISIALNAPRNATAIAELKRRYSAEATVTALRDAYTTLLEP